jgi:hypothetical protein
LSKDNLAEASQARRLNQYNQHEMENTKSQRTNLFQLDMSKQVVVVPIRIDKNPSEDDPS